VGQRVINVKVGVGMGVVVGGMTDVVIAWLQDSEPVASVRLDVNVSVGSSVPVIDRERVFFDFDSVGSREVDGVALESVAVPVGTRESEDEGVFIDLESESGMETDSVSKCEKLAVKAERVKEGENVSLMEAVSESLSEFVGGSVTEGVSSSVFVNVNETEGDNDAEIEAETEKEKEGEGVKVSVFCERERVGGGEAVNVPPVSLTEMVSVSVNVLESVFESEKVIVAVGGKVSDEVTLSVEDSDVETVSLTDWDFVNVLDSDRVRESEKGVIERVKVFVLVAVPPLFESETEMEKLCDVSIVPETEIEVETEVEISAVWDSDNETVSENVTDFDKEREIDHKVTVCEVVRVSVIDFDEVSSAVSVRLVLTDLETVSLNVRDFVVVFDVVRVRPRDRDAVTDRDPVNDAVVETVEVKVRPREIDAVCVVDFGAVIETVSEMERVELLEESRVAEVYVEVREILESVQMNVIPSSAAAKQVLWA
jgi:hypothetical protein